MINEKSIEPKQLEGRADHRSPDLEGEAKRNVEGTEKGRGKDQQKGEEKRQKTNVLPKFEA